MDKSMKLSQESADTERVVLSRQKVEFSTNIITSLMCEAKSLIDYYSLTKVLDKPFQLYRGYGENKTHHINLVISGIGGTEASTAIGWLGALTVDYQCSWLNFGCAGHKTSDLGDLYLVHQCSNDQSTRTYYPPLVVKWSGESAALESHILPCETYPQDKLVDMEASNFFTSASKFADAEVIQSIKVVSDNENSGIENINAKFIIDIMSPHTEVVVQFIDNLRMINPPRLIEYDTLHLISSLHTTVSQRRIYTQLISRLQSLDMWTESVIGLITACVNEGGQDSTSIK